MHCIPALQGRKRQNVIYVSQVQVFFVDVKESTNREVKR